MNKLGILLLSPLAFLACKNEMKESMPIPPLADKKPKELTVHNDTRIDNYYWLNERENPEVIQYLEDENAYTKTILKSTEKLQDELFEEIVGRIKQDDNSVPYFKNGYYYYVRYETGKEYPVYCRKKESLDNPEEVLLNGNQMAEGKSFFQIGGLAVSPNNQYLAYSVDEVSRRQYKIFVKDLSTGKTSASFIENTTGGITWAADNATFFYCQRDESLRPYQVYASTWNGADIAAGTLVFEEKDATFSVGVGKSKSGDYLMIHSSSTTTDEFQYLDAKTPNGTWQIFHPRERGIEYTVDHNGKEFFVTTNWEAQNFRVMTAQAGKTTKENWVEVIPHDEKVLIDAVEVFADYLVTEEQFDANARIRQFTTDGKIVRELNFDEEVFTAYIGMNAEVNANEVRIGYTSLTTPTSVLDFDLKTGEKNLLKENEVLGNFDRTNYTAVREWATAEDGTKIPISLVYRNDKYQKTGSNPALIYGYGSYGYSISPYFSSARLSLLDRGFVFAIAHIRGGEEMGRSWYEDGKLLKKKNTFTDFVACSEHLIQQQYAKADELYAMGGSAGGLLMGAIINMRPDLYHGVIASVPFVDVVTTMLDESIPLTTGEFDEWGNPKNEEYYHYIKSYSPYDQVSAQDYPHLLVTTGLHDSQVQYWEPAKWVAKLRDTKTDNNLLLLHTNMETGHSGNSGRFQVHKETAMEYAFLLSLHNKTLQL